MVARGLPTPSKLKADAIAEAVFEVRFDAAVGSIPEFFFARIADRVDWKGFQQRVLPAYQLPAPLRDADEGLKYQPILELISPDGRQSLKMGGRSLSYHRMPEYVGWTAFERELRSVIDSLFDSLSSIEIRRLGLRYINALNESKHKISKISDLDIAISTGTESIDGCVNLNYSREIGNRSALTVRIATPEFVQSVNAKTSSVYIDVDVYTQPGFSSRTKDELVTWIDFAHTSEKHEFFHLFKQSTIDLLTES